jgi:hypothetical protein
VGAKAGIALVSLFKEMMAMRYLWRAPFELDNARLLRLLGEAPRTAWGAAVAQALAGIGCTGAPLVR